MSVPSPKSDISHCKTLEIHSDTAATLTLRSHGVPFLWEPHSWANDISIFLINLARVHCMVKYYCKQYLFQRNSVITDWISIYLNRIVSILCPNSLSTWSPHIHHSKNLLTTCQQPRIFKLFWRKQLHNKVNKCEISWLIPSPHNQIVQLSISSTIFH